MEIDAVRCAGCGSRAVLDEAGDQASQGAVPRIVRIELVVEFPGSEDATLERPKLFQEIGLLFEGAKEQEDRQDGVSPDTVSLPSVMR